jgi:hypothetical protein
VKNPGILPANKGEVKRKEEKFYECRSGNLLSDDGKLYFVFPEEVKKVVQILSFEKTKCNLYAG